MGAPKTTSSKRWRPTGEQVMILKGLFKGGLTTPSAHQIQKITTQLREYGKVESKNVFYWFQNHKAREKQKLAKKLLYHNNHNHLLYYFYLPTHYPSGVYPLLPPQAMRDSLQLRSLEKPAEMITRYCDGGTKEEAATKDNGSSSVDVTWLTTEYDSSHHHHQHHHHDHHDHQKNHQGSLKTLELFPTTPTSSSSYSSSICIAN